MILTIIIPITIILTKKVNLTTITTTTTTESPTNVISTTTITTTTERIFNGLMIHFNGQTYVPSMFTTADINGDNKTDIIAIHDITSSIAVRLTTDNGTFYTQLNYSTGSSSAPHCITAADLDDDNKPDIIVGNIDTRNIGVFLNTGEGTFHPQMTYPAPFGTTYCSLSTADVDGDKKLDIILIGTHISKVSVFFNRGIGTFEPQVTYFIGLNSNPRSVTTADVNGDNKPEIILANYDTHNIVILLNTDDGTFNFRLNYSTGYPSYPCFVTTDDLNGDTKPDIIVTYCGEQNIGIFFNTGHGTFHDQLTYSTGVGSHVGILTTADLNNDNKTDLIVAQANNVAIFLNRGNGTFDDRIICHSGFSTAPYFITTVDLNNDNKADIIFSSYGIATLTVLFAWSN